MLVVAVKLSEESRDILVLIVQADNLSAVLFRSGRSLLLRSLSRSCVFHDVEHVEFRLRFRLFFHRFFRSLMFFFVGVAGETGCDDGDDNFVFKFGVDASAEDDVCADIHNVLNEAASFVDFAEREIQAAGNVKDNAGCAFDVGFEKRALHCLTNCFQSAVFAFAGADTHVSEALVFHNGSYVREVQVDESRIYDKVAYALNALTENVVGNLEGFDDRGALRNYLQKFR